MDALEWVDITVPRSLRNLVTTLAEAKGGDIVAAVAHKTLHAAIERAVARAEVDVLIASSSHEESVLVRRKDRDREGDWTFLSLLCRRA